MNRELIEREARATLKLDQEVLQAEEENPTKLKELHHDPDPQTSKFDLWDQQRGESPSHYRWFLRYRDYGPARSVAKVADHYKGSRYTLAHMAGNFRWRDRAQAWDAWIEQEASLEAIHLRRGVIGKHLDIADGFIKKVGERLLQLDPRELSPTAMILWLDKAAMLERLSLDMATLDKNGQTVQNNSVTNNTAIVNVAPSAEIEERIKQYAAVYRKMEEAQRTHLSEEDNRLNRTRLQISDGGTRQDS